MPNRSELLSSIATTIADYRAGELTPPTPEHVDKWICQFEKDVQIPLLKELNHVLINCYYNRSDILKYLEGLLTNKKLAGDNPGEYWRSVNFLDIQEYGESQHEMLKILGEKLNEQFGITFDTCGGPSGDYIYIDDIMFTGTHIGNDIEKWILKTAPSKARIQIIVIAIHTLAEYQVEDRLKSIIKSSKKEIVINFWRSKNIENRKAFRKDAEVLWPAELPDDPLVTSYLAGVKKFPFEPRPSDGKLGPFYSEAGRQLLERELLLAGLKIRSWCANPKDIMRPLGFSPFSLGFGSMIVTYRNCPNNCPLALWWGDPEEGASSPLSKWYPLFPRKTYTT